MSTGNYPDDLERAVRDSPRMPQDELLARIAEYLTPAGLSERKASLRASGGPDFIRDLKRRGKRAPAADTLIRLARVIGAPAQYLLDAVEEAQEAGGTSAALTQVTVRGDVQAGVWREATEWPSDEWYSVTAPADDRYPGLTRFGLLVRGNSMDRLYPDGTIVLVIRFSDLGHSIPRPGQRVVVLRRDKRTGEFEATLKEYDQDSQGRHILWPRSNDPEFQAPFVLSGQMPLPFHDETVPSAVRAGPPPEQAGEPDLQIFALVVGSYRPE